MSKGRWVCGVVISCSVDAPRIRSPPGATPPAIIVFRYDAISFAEETTDPVPQALTYSRGSATTFTAPSDPGTARYPCESSPVAGAVSSKVVRCIPIGAKRCSRM